MEERYGASRTTIRRGLRLNLRKPQGAAGLSEVIMKTVLSKPYFLIPLILVGLLVNGALLIGGLSLLAKVFAPKPTAEVVEPEQAGTRAYLSDCEKAMETAAAMPDMKDKVEDVDPAIRSCESMNELIAASSKFPAALDGVDESTFVSNRCTYNSSLKSTLICRSLLSTLTTIHYLAVNSETPAPKDAVPVADRETIKMLVSAAQGQDREKYNSIAASSSVALISGGAVVDIVTTDGELVQVKLRSRDVRGNDLSGQVRWTHSKFIQNRQMKS